MATNFKEYNEHKIIINQVSEYLRWKEDVLKGKVAVDEETKKLINFLAGYYSQCETSWADFINQYRFVKHINQVNLSRYIASIIPDTGDIMNPGYFYTHENIPDEGFYIGYDFKDKLLFRRNYRTVMLDYDVEDGVDRQNIINKITDIVNMGKNYGLNFVFAVLVSDRGVHAYLVSHRYNRDSLSKKEDLVWVDFLKMACNDPYYTAFTYDLGFSSRLNKKQGHPEDNVVWTYPYVDDFSLFHGRPDINSYTYTFFSNYYQQEVTIYYPTGMKFIGDTEYILDVNDAYADYMLSQFLKDIDTKQLEIDIYAPFLYPNDNSDITNLRKDIMHIITHISENIQQINAINSQR